MWSLTLPDVQSLRGAGGTLLAGFVDLLLRAEADRVHVPQAEVHTQLRQNVGDGGVDTRIDRALLGGMGFTDVPTGWQYKAVDQPDLNVVEIEGELRKHEATRILGLGYGYCVCTTAAVPPHRVTQIEGALLRVAASINPAAPPPRLVTPDMIVEWARRFPMVVAARFRRFPLRALAMPQWTAAITNATPTYFEIEEWRAAAAEIDAHASFGTPVADACLSISGPSGVGKTRLVHERLSRLAGADALVAYVEDDDAASEVTEELQRHGGTAAIVVVEDCSLDRRVRLSDRLRAVRERVRVFCLDNTGSIATGERSIRLPLPTSERVVQVLRANFPMVPDDHRHSYATLSEGYIRLAADLCESDAEITQSGNLPGRVSRYVLSRLPDGHRLAAEALALFTKVGFKDGLEEEAECVASLTGVGVGQLRRAVSDLKNTPGFLSVQGRYWRVTPEVVSRVLFGAGWDRFVRDDPTRFLTGLLPQLHERIVDRARLSGNREAGEVIASTFREWLNAMTPGDLADAENAEQLAALVEMFPAEGIPTLSRVFTTATPEELLAIVGEASRSRSGWGPRRALVWLCERLAAFPEHWSIAESVLFRLATYETEQRIGNNATEIWAQIHRAVLSGTATPFRDRFDVFAARARCATGAEVAAVLAGCKELVDAHPTRMGGPPTFAGRVRPPEWSPTRQQRRDALEAVVRLMLEVRASPPELGTGITAIGIEKFALLVQAGLVGLGIELIRPELGVAKVRSDALVSITRFVHETKEHWAGSMAPEVLEYLRECELEASRLAPTDFSSRLRVLLSRPTWGEEILDESQRAGPAIRALAAEVIAEPQRLTDEMPWLCSPEATAAVVFGESLGALDREAILLDPIVAAARGSGQTGLLRGYVTAYRSATEDLAVRLRSHVDRLAAAGSTVAVDMILANGDAAGGPQKLLEMVDSGALPAKYLVTAVYGVGGRRLTAAEANGILSRLAAAVATDGDGASAALRAMGAFTSRSPILEQDDEVTHRERLERIWALLSRMAIPTRGSDVYTWKDLLLLSAPRHAEEVIDLLVRALGSESHSAGDVAEEAVAQLAKSHSAVVMPILGAALIAAEETGGWMRVRQFRSIFSTLDPAHVAEWLDSEGVAGARAIARHLPPPGVDSDGRPVLPEVLRLVLARFEVDDETFGVFASSVHAHEGWTGNGAALFRAQADVARKFLDHPLRRIREWAAVEIKDREAWADREEREHAERDL